MITDDRLTRIDELLWKSMNEDTLLIEVLPDQWSYTLLDAICSTTLDVNVRVYAVWVCHWILGNHSLTFIQAS